MSAETHSIDPLASARARLGGPVPFLVYVAMFGGALLGSLAGAVYDAILGQMYLWVLFTFAALGATFVGARYGKRRVGHPLKSDQRVRIALFYTAAFAATLGLAFIGWPLLLPHWALARIDGLSSAGQAGALALTALTFASVTLLHYLLLSLFTPSNGRSPAASSHA